VTGPGNAIAQRFAAALTDLREHTKVQPAEADAIVCSLVAHLRAWRPESVAPLGTLPEPTEKERDPRGGV
jgi:hypothetical protein